MIGNSYPGVKEGYSVLEQGEMCPQTYQLKVQAYLVCAPNGQHFDKEFKSIEEANEFIATLDE